ncbi:MAG: bifunctional adenosylcobinamide kinase/adenosylcobinamide-phosphate guanylyltransferase, partial [Actinomycetota bacterium]|nr:bifunctional adenosylcobinamide kinase/adenosylcobinamide-phosphate guanylyltransferase [Actinomycetota bacterium]
MRILVLGGIRSGKSQWAESAIAQLVTGSHPLCYLATGPAPAGDAEWQARVAAHRNRRPHTWS